jgi:hypothetical protein
MVRQDAPYGTVLTAHERHVVVVLILIDQLVSTLLVFRSQFI